MSRENVGVVERTWRACQGGDLSAALADIDKDFVAIRAARPMPDVVPYYGREGMVQMLAD